MNEFLENTVSRWTLPGISVSGEDDQRRLSQFLKDHPLLEQALAHHMAGFAFQVPGAVNHHFQQPASAPAGIGSARPAGPLLMAAPAHHPHGSTQARRSDPENLPRQPLRMSAARAKYSAHYTVALGTQKDRTKLDKDRLYDQFEEFLQQEYPELGVDPWVHCIDSSHVMSFLEGQAARPGKRQDEEGQKRKAAPTTLLKKLSDLSHFFTYLRQTAKATKEDLAGDLSQAAEAWRRQASNDDVHYRPFTDKHIQQIFEPSAYLATNREPDYFWGPLLGLHLGVRLGDFVSTKLTDIGQLEEIGVWYIDITPEGAKNSNSVRRLPVTEPLIRLGFIDYVNHVRSLGATYLFPHRDWNGFTARHDRSKNQSRRFGEHMDKVGLRDPLLVFHSFRHTVISAMQDAGVPLAHAMQIVGHEAQDHAIRSNSITATQARSVHLKVYTHTDLERLGTSYPIVTLKDALERSLRLPLDYTGLKTAGAIVLRHLKKVAGQYRAGWPPQRHSYTAQMQAQLSPAAI